MNATWTNVKGPFKTKEEAKLAALEMGPKNHSIYGQWRETESHDLDDELDWYVQRLDGSTDAPPTKSRIVEHKHKEAA